MKTEKWIYWIIAIAILIRIPLLFLNPITMWTDPSFRYLPNTYDVLEGDFRFYTPPLLMILNAFPTIFLDGFLLELTWKLIPFIFFILSILVFMQILKIIELKKESKIFLLCLFLFNVYSILMSTSIMLEMPTLFFTLFLFYIFEKNEKADLKLFFLIAITTALLLYSKQTGYFILAGFFVYIFFKKMDGKQKKLILIALILGLLLNAPWMIKNKILYDTVLEKDVSNISGISQVIDFNANYPNLIIEIFHLFYRIPFLNQLNYGGFLFFLSRIYYFSFVIISILLSWTILIGVAKFGREYGKYILMILPVFLFVSWITFLFDKHWTVDFGRYMFSFYFLFFFFGMKYIENLNKAYLRKFFYGVVILSCIFSVATSYAMSYEFHQKDSGIKDVGKFILDKKGEFFSNDHYTKHALIFYSGKEILPLENKIQCGSGTLVHSNLKYEVYLKENNYSICGG